MTGTVDPELRARQAAALSAQARANGWTASPDPDVHQTHPDPDVRALIERHRREAAAEALREAARALPGFDGIRTHGDAARWLRNRADALAGDR